MDIQTYNKASELLERIEKINAVLANLKDSKSLTSTIQERFKDDVEMLPNMFDMDKCSKASAELNAKWAEKLTTLKLRLEDELADL
ncbi:MAG: hypothetical protein H6937_09560 [Burkholderiales bacterium]|nr:hypothetical protein [Burkholderiales bacterium]